MIRTHGDIWAPVVAAWAQDLSEPLAYALPDANTLWEDAALYVLRGLGRNNLVLYGDVQRDTLVAFAQQYGVDEHELASFSQENLDPESRFVVNVTDGTDDGAVYRKAADAIALELAFFFEDRWRFSRGWLTRRDLGRTLFSGSDGLASRMADAVIHELHPTSDMAQWRRTCIYPKRLH
jgi:hypothetical protein